MIKEVIVVEGRDDISAIKRAVEAETIATHGFGISKQTIKRIQKAYESRGIIIFTDPDFAGEKIRKRLGLQFPNAKHAYVSKEDACKDGDIGIENTSAENIRHALSKARSQRVEAVQTFTLDDMFSCGLSGDENAARRRDLVGGILGIGYGNTKAFLNRLNGYMITKEELESAVENCCKEGR